MLPLLLTLLACRDKDGADTAAAAADAVTPGCHPAIAEVCALPFPSTDLMVEDGTTETGWRVSVPDGVLPTNALGAPFDPVHHNRLDGFSTWGPLVAWLGPIDEAALTPARGDLSADTMLYVLDAETGERVPAWGELDRLTDDDGLRTLTIRLARPMGHGRRYVVGIQGLTDPDGATIAAPEGFAALRDGQGPSSHQPRYDDDIFPVLEAAGLERASLQLAWDLVTVSEPASLGPARHMAAQAQAYTPEVSITSVEDFDCGAEGVTIGRHVAGTFTAPLFLDAEERFLSRDADGLPVQSGEATADFIARIPCGVLADPAPGWVVQFGHGFLGGKEELEQAYLGEMQEAHRWVMVAADWRGMSAAERSDIQVMLAQDASDFPIIPDRVQQAYVEFDRLLYAARFLLAEEEALQVDGIPLIDSEKYGFYGISQGGVLGAGYLGFSPSLTRGALSVPGGPFTTLMPRSGLFAPFLLLFQTAYDEPRELAALIASLQTLWDPGEGAGWVGVTDKDMLIQTGLGDAQVTTIGAQDLARALDATLLTPATRDVFGLEAAEDGFSGSAYVEWDFTDVPTAPAEAVPADLSTDTHRCVRRELAAQQQLQAFIETGVVTNYCDGSCTTSLASCEEE